MEKIFTLRSILLATVMLLNVYSNKICAQITNIDVAQATSNPTVGDGYKMSLDGDVISVSIENGGQYNLTGTSNYPLSVSAGDLDGEIVLTVDESVNPFSLHTYSNVIIKSNSTKNPIELCDLYVADKLTLESDLICRRTISSVGFVDFHPTALLDIKDYTFYVYDEAGNVSGYNTGRFNAYNVRANDNGKILIYANNALNEEIVCGEADGKSYRRNTSTSDDLAFIEVHYYGEAPQNGILSVVKENGDVNNSDDVVAEFNTNGFYKGFAALVPSSNKYNLYYNDFMQEGAIGSPENRKQVFEILPNYICEIYDINNVVSKLDISKFTDNRLNLNYNNEQYYVTDNNGSNFQFNGIVTGERKKDVVLSINSSMDITFEDLNIIGNNSYFEVGHFYNANVNVIGNNIVYSENISLVVSNDAILDFSELSETNTLVLFGKYPIVNNNNGKITNLIEWVWDSPLSENTEIKLVFEDKTEKNFKSPGQFRTFAVNTNGPVELYINGIKQKAYLDEEEFTTFKTSDNNEFVSYTKVTKSEEPSVIETELKLEKEGEGELKATYFTANPEKPEDETEHILYADTVTTITPKTITVTATPSENYELEKLVTVNGDNEQVIPDVVAGKSFSYEVASNTTLKAYFKKKELANVEVRYNITDNKGSIGISFNDKLPASYSEIPAGVSEIKVVAKPLFGFKLSDDIFITENDKTVGVSDGSSYKLKGSSSIVIAATFVEDGSEEVKEELEKAPVVKSKEPAEDVKNPTVVASNDAFGNLGDGQSVKVISEAVTKETEVKVYIWNNLIIR